MPDRDTCPAPSAGRRIGSETYVQIGLVITLVGAVAWGASEIATLRAINEAQTQRLVSLEAYRDGQTAAAGAINQRLARIEVMLEQLREAAGWRPRVPNDQGGNR